MPFPISKQDLEFIFEICARSPYVSGNSDYKKKTRGTEIVFNNRDVVNAYAESLGGNRSRITMLNGLCNITIPMAFALAKFQQDEDIDALANACNVIGDHGSTFHDNDIEPMLNKLGYDVNNSYLFEEAKSYFTGMLLSVVAHELGHICLSHCIRTGGNYETSRNDERSADLFAQSVISTTPFSRYLIMSSLFMEVLFTWMSKHDDGPATTHPHSRERVYNTVNSHEQYLEHIGISRDTIDEFLP